MKLNRRIERLEGMVIPKPAGCNPAVLIVRWEDEESVHLHKYDSCEPTHEEIEQYLKYMKDSGQCQGCLGSCALDWAPGGFTNHKLTGERNSSSSSPTILVISCTSAEARILTRRLLNGEGTE